jgi:hypothetical protein
VTNAAPDPRVAPEEAVNPDVRFEHQDVKPGVVARWAVALGLLSIVVAAFSVWFLVFLRRREEGADPRRPALYFAEELRQPEGVQLQNAPFHDLQVLREHEAQFLHGYGWVDRSAGVVHIPIEQAMHLYIERQARATAAASASPAADDGVPTDSAPVPSPRALAATPLPAPPPSPPASGTPAPPPAHGPGPTGARR